MHDVQYTYFADIEFPNHYANQLTLTLSDSLSDILTFFYKHTYYQPYPSVFTYFLEETCLYTADYIFIKEPTEPQRKEHGALHANDTAIAAVIFFKLYEKYSSKSTKDKINALIQAMPGVDQEQQRAFFLKLLQIATAFHDSGRLGNGSDREEWEKQGANDCQLFIEKLLTNSHVVEAAAHEIAQFFAEAIARKDAPRTMGKSIIQSCIQSADCIEIIRCKKNFSVNCLDIWMDAMGIRDTQLDKVIDPQKSAQLQKEIFYLLYEWMEILQTQGKLKHRTQIQLQTTYQTNASRFYFHHRKRYYKTTAEPRIDAQQKREMLKFSDIVSELGHGTFPMFSKYYLGNTEAHYPPLKALDDAITQYVAFRHQCCSKPPLFENTGIDNVALALIHLRYQLKNNVTVDKKLSLDGLNTIQEATIALVKLLEQHNSQHPGWEKNIPNLTGFKGVQDYHEKLVSVLKSNRCIYLQTAAQFLLTAAILSLILTTLSAVATFALGGMAAACLATLFTPSSTILGVSVLGGVLQAGSAFFKNPHQKLNQCVNAIEKHIDLASNGFHTSAIQNCKQYSFHPPETYYEDHFLRAR